MDLVESSWEYVRGSKTWQYAAFVTVEEGIEMPGIVAFVYALFLCIREHLPGITVRVI